MKTCTKCGIEYPSTIEYFNRRNPTQLVGHCKKCTHKYNVINKEHNDKVSAKRYVIHRLEILARKKAIYLDQHPREQRPKGTGWQPLQGRYPEIERQIKAYAASR